MFNILKAAAIFLTMVIAVCLPGFAEAAAGSTIVSVSAPALPVSPGAQFTVSLNVQLNSPIAGAQCSLSFDPSLVSISSISEGNLLRQNGANTFFNEGQIDNNAGSITGMYGAILSAGQSVSTSGTFAIITLTAGATGGTCPLTLSNVIIGDVNGEALPIIVVDGQVSIDLVGAVAKLSFTTQPSVSNASGIAFGTQPVVTVQDAGGNPVTTSNATVTLAITAGTGTSGAVLSGTATVNSVNGVTTFSGLSINLEGTGYTLTATSEGLTSSTSDPFNISKVACSTNITSSLNPSIYGQSVTLTATVKAVPPAIGIPAGIVTFNDGSSELGTKDLDNSGQATWNISALSTGRHMISAIFDGDTNFVATSSNLTQVVNQGSTAVKMTSSSNPSTSGQSVTFTATVKGESPASPSGTVTFKDANAELGTQNLSSSGQATYSTSTLSAGSHPISAIYSGDTNFAVSTFNLTQTVNQTSGGGVVVVGGGFGGGGGVTLNTKGFSNTGPLKIDSNGVLLQNFTITSADGKFTLEGSKGTKLLTMIGTAMANLTVEGLDSPPRAPIGDTIVAVYNFGSEGCTFDPALTFTFSYSFLPADVDENTLTVVYYNGALWATVPGKVNTVGRTITAQISHFSLYAVIGRVNESVAPTPTPTLTPTPISTPTPTATPAPTPTPTSEPSPTESAAPIPPVSALAVEVTPAPTSPVTTLTVEVTPAPVPTVSSSPTITAPTKSTPSRMIIIFVVVGIATVLAVVMTILRVRKTKT